MFALRESRLFTEAVNIAAGKVRSSLNSCNFTRNSASTNQCWFSTVKALSRYDQPIKILYASQTGTAKLFAYQLNDQLCDEYPDRDISLQQWSDVKPEEMLKPGKALHVFLTSVAGVGEPPDNGREFYDYIMNNSTSKLDGLEYAVFGLGSTAGHAAYFNVIGKSLDKRLEEMGASRVLEVGLGDDGDCIEDDFDNWADELNKFLHESTSSNDRTEGVHSKEDVDGTGMEDKSNELRTNCPGIALREDGTRLISKKFPTLELISKPSKNEHVLKHLFHLNKTSEQFYTDNTVSLDVIGNKLLGIEAGESGIHELKLTASNLTYETGDHLVVYPQNSQCIVDAYLDMLDVNRHAIIDKNYEPNSYPYPKGLTVRETLTHCVDLGALPSPSFSRMITGKNDIDYKSEIAYPRRTVLDLALQYERRLSLEDLLFQATPMKPRYYSIASSNIKHPDEIRLVYRRVQYVTKLGMLREGVCTNYLSHKGFIDTDKYASIAAYVNDNPTFRLPQSTETPLLFIAGGCGVAPIRGLLEERVALAQSETLGPATLYLGFRSPEDEVYRAIIEDAIKVGALTQAEISYSTGSKNNCLVSDVIRQHGDRVWKHFEGNGVTFLCGGARSFGAAIESAFLDIIQTHGKVDFEDAEQYLRRMIKDGRLMDDLAD